MSDLILIRDAVKADHDFIYDSWLNHFEHTSYISKKTPKEIFMREHSITVNHIMNRDNVVVKIAGDAEFSIFAYIVAESVHNSPVIHYLYVRPEYQRLGIARKLIDSLNLPNHFEVSHWTQNLNQITFDCKSFKFNQSSKIMNYHDKTFIHNSHRAWRQS